MDQVGLQEAPHLWDLYTESFGILQMLNFFEQRSNPLTESLEGSLYSLEGQ
jgi:hypothetical protein